MLRRRWTLRIHRDAITSLYELGKVNRDAVVPTRDAIAALAADPVLANSEEEDETHRRYQITVDNIQVQVHYQILEREQAVLIREVIFSS